MYNEDVCIQTSTEQDIDIDDTTIGTCGYW